jgi:uncharacterized membrane protein (DUF485 family)
MKLFSRKLSDAEFVARLHKRLDKGKRYARFGLIFHALFLCVVIYLFISAYDLISSFKADFGRTPEASTSFQMGLLLGLGIGSFLLMLLFHTIYGFINCLILLLGSRRDKLLVAYYDRLYPLDAKAPAPSSALKN